MKNNPYVGPRPYERADRANFFGRGREARDLLALILAERVLLFYAQSGAGKTSLLNAQVIPALEDKGFDVLPMARVGSDLPPGIDPAAAPNVFVFSTLMALAGADVLPETLLAHTLLSFLQTRVADKPPLLVLDQFEELFTTHRDRWQEARDFFVQMRQALEDIPNLGVTLAMREDHIAELDPYAPLLPGRLRARFRMERLGAQAAIEAVANPARNAGCPFDPGVAERLVDDLRRIKTQIPPSVPPIGGEEKGGTSASPLPGGIEGGVLGPHVEPVQLQVVCNRLWERLPDQADNAIQWEEVAQYGDIDRALVDFYESALVKACEQATPKNPVAERQLRRWFSEQLITPMETRGLALRGPEDTAGLPNAAVDVLEAQHLVRADVRAGARWYELCHDRMVAPIVQSNAGWEAARQTPLRTAAKQWKDNQGKGLLYRGGMLREALAWAKANPDEIEDYEKEFLQAGRQAQQARGRVLLAIFAALTTLIVFLGPVIYRQWLRWRAQTLGELVLIEPSRAILGDEILPLDYALPVGVYTIPAFAIEKYEVTNGRYLLCMAANVCSPPITLPSEYKTPERSQYPVTGITALQAIQFCGWIGRRLPTEMEWERAARFTDGRPWPWGDSLPKDTYQACLNYDDQDDFPIQKVGRATQGLSLEGIYDLAGNVWEWTCSPYTRTETISQPLENQECDPNLIERLPPRLVRKGGSAEDDLYAIESTMAYRMGWKPFNSDAYTGFRCVSDP
ncbi:MAG: SUMF1/EgtB/PvdO family nonheme iron enzyme [Anaerolineae bacterium]|nr:SUMF1/EgtB/PvdO family nonheme iron enzyme [Anaerolineae bacterium]